MVSLFDFLDVRVVSYNDICYVILYCFLCIKRVLGSMFNCDFFGISFDLLLLMLGYLICIDDKVW